MVLRNNDASTTYVRAHVVAFPSNGSMFNLNCDANYNIGIMGNTVVISGSVTDGRGFVKSFMDVANALMNETTEENCQSIVNEFNSHLTANVFLSGDEQGTISLTTEANTNDPTKFHPMMLLRFKMFNNEPMTVSQVLEMMGISLDDLKAMFGMQS